jgi:hypothetical protein
LSADVVAARLAIEVEAMSVADVVARLTADVEEA